jgi:hypothetical protein
MKRVKASNSYIRTLIFDSSSFYVIFLFFLFVFFVFQFFLSFPPFFLFSFLLSFHFIFFTFIFISVFLAPVHFLSSLPQFLGTASLYKIQLSFTNFIIEQLSLRVDRDGCSV